MTKIYSFPRQDQRYDDASVWIAKLDKGLSPADREMLGEWLAADTRNRDVLLQMAELWDNMSALSRLSDLFPIPATSASRPRQVRWAAAAAVVIAVLAAGWAAIMLDLETKPAESRASGDLESEIVFATAKGEQSTVHLPDGSNVVLNTDSLIKVDYTQAYRLLRLERGELHVEVARDTARPFFVIAGDKIVRAVGTAFSLEITSDQRIELIVTEGKVVVGVNLNPDAVLANVAPNGLHSSVTVTAGEQMILDVDDEETKSVSPEEIDIKLSWRQGNLVFRGESLEDAVAEIGRYTTVEFVIVDEDLKKVRIAGMFKAGDVDGLLATLRENFNVTYERTGDGKILLTAL